MNPNLQRFEAQLEQWFEGAFTGLFGRTVRARDLALHIARAVENGAEASSGGDERPIAPDEYTVRLHSETLGALHEQHEGLEATLALYIRELVERSGYRLSGTPAVRLVADPKLAASDVVVDARQRRRPSSATAVLQRVDLPQAATQPNNPHLLIDGERAFALTGALITIGRSHENVIVVNDGHTSRFHAQLRLRFGSYTVFDTNSQSGTFVNEVPVREHILQSGDVIRLGKTRMVYLEDERSGDGATRANSPLD